MNKVHVFTAFAAFVTAVMLSACGDSSAPGSLLGSDPSPAAKSTGQVVPGQYIVVFNDDVGNPRAETERMAATLPGEVRFIYEHALKGFAIENLPEQAAGALARNPRIKYVEPDRVVQLFAQTIPTGIQRIFADENTQIGIDGTDDSRVDVDVAIIDTGIDFEHPDLNVHRGTDCTNLTGVGAPWTREATCLDGGGDDDHYHGTHVAGTVGAIDNGSGVVGVAPGARLWAVKVLDSSGSGYASNIIAGIDWVAANAAYIEVANMSLGGSGFSQAEYDAIQGAVDAGVAFAVAAGNDDDDAKNYSPAAFDNVLTVSALADFDGEPDGKGSPTCLDDQDDTLADFSNWGDAVQIAAPGVCILSTFPIEQGEYGTISGTSMASPHAAGALALLASNSNPGNATDVSNLYGQVIDAGNSDWTDDSGDGTKEPLLDVSTFVPVLVSGGGSENQSPTASFTYTTSDLTADFTDQSTDSDGSVTAWSWDFGDGATSTAQNPSHTYAAAGTYTVSLTVTDDEGATGSTSQDVTVSDSQPTNAPPTAAFTYTTTDLTADFTDQSTDSDGSVTAWSWDFGDGATSTAQNPSHTYAADGTYTVSLTVTDDDDATDTVSEDVTVSSGSGDAFELFVTAEKIRGTQYAYLTWTPYDGDGFVDVLRDGSVVATTENNGEYDHEPGIKGGGSATYKICEAVDGGACSNEVFVTW